MDAWNDDQDDQQYWGDDQDDDRYPWVAQPYALYPQFQQLPPTTPSVSHGGYGYEFVEETPNKFICNICAKVLRDPYLTECCGQHYCESCIKHWIRQSGAQVCPHCRNRNFVHILNRALKREINELKVYCINHEKGCKWKNELGNLETHLKDCGYVEVECSNKCNQRLMRNKLGDHLRSECLLREYMCTHCHRVDTYHAITGDCPPNEIYCPKHPSHYDSCPELKLKCSKCGERNIKRKDMGEHQSHCPKEPVECRFKEAGCDVKPLRSELDDHMTQNTQQHLVLMMGAFRKLKEECNNYKERLVYLESQLPPVSHRYSQGYVDTSLQLQGLQPAPGYMDSVPLKHNSVRQQSFAVASISQQPCCIFEKSFSKSFYGALSKANSTL